MHAWGLCWLGKSWINRTNSKPKACDTAAPKYFPTDTLSVNKVKLCFKVLSKLEILRTF